MRARSLRRSLMAGALALSLVAVTACSDDSDDTPDVTTPGDTSVGGGSDTTTGNTDTTLGGGGTGTGDTGGTGSSTTSG